MTSSPRDEGYIACIDHRPAASCPYPKDLRQERIEWLEGWLAAHQTCLVQSRNSRPRFQSGQAGRGRSHH